MAMISCSTDTVQEIDQGFDLEPSELPNALAGNSNRRLSCDERFQASCYKSRSGLNGYDSHHNLRRMTPSFLVQLDRKTKTAIRGQSFKPVFRNFVTVVTTTYLPKSVCRHGRSQVIPGHRLAELPCRLLHKPSCVGGSMELFSPVGVQPSHSSGRIDGGVWDSSQNIDRVPNLVCIGGVAWPLCFFKCPKKPEAGKP